MDPLCLLLATDGMAFLGPRAVLIVLAGKAYPESFSPALGNFGIPPTLGNFGFPPALGTFGFPPLA